jgi:hypothetical protein
MLQYIRLPRSSRYIPWLCDLTSHAYIPLFLHLPLGYRVLELGLAWLMRQDEKDIRLHVVPLIHRDEVLPQMNKGSKIDEIVRRSLL